MGLSRLACSMSAMRSAPPSITFVTGNAKKLEEVTAILNGGSPLPFAIDNRSLDLPELQGEPEDIAREKCVLAARAARRGDARGEQWRQADLAFSLCVGVNACAAARGKRAAEPTTS